MKDLTDLGPSPRVRDYEDEVLLRFDAQLADQGYTPYIQTEWPDQARRGKTQRLVWWPASYDAAHEAGQTSWRRLSLPFTEWLAGIRQSHPNW